MFDYDLKRSNKTEKLGFKPENVKQDKLRHVKSVKKSMKLKKN